MPRALKSFIMLLPLIVTLAVSSCSQRTNRKNIILTGYWPPSNLMLSQFCMDTRLNPAGYKGSNWQNRGYDIYAFFPVFDGDPSKNPAGKGNFQVDYQKTLSDFSEITSRLCPVAIISFGRGKGPWEIEYNFVNCPDWLDDYIPPVKMFSYPLDQTVPLGYKRNSTLPVQAIEKSVNSAAIGINAWVDYDGDAGNFLCNYIAYLGAKYQADHVSSGDPHPCIAAGFIHVSAEVPVDKAVKATEITLLAVIDYLDSKNNDMTFLTGK